MSIELENEVPSSIPTPPINWLRLFKNQTTGGLSYKDDQGVVQNLATGVSSEEVQDIIGTFVQAGSNKVLVTYNDAANALYIDIQPGNIAHSALSGVGTNSHAQIDSHIASGSNPHNVTQSQVGLGNVNNTSDLDKPVSTATQTALNLKENSITGGLSTQVWNGLKQWIALTADYVAETATKKWFTSTEQTKLASITSIGSGQIITTGERVLLGTAVQPGDLATVATTGDFNDLINTPSAMVFGQNFQETSNQTLATNTNSAVWETHSTLTTPTLPIGKYRIGVFIVWGHSSTANNFQSQLTVNGVQKGTFALEASDAGADILAPASGFFYHEVATPQILEIDIDFKPETNGQTARVFYSGIEFWRVS